ncbi:enhancer of split m8 protein [Drosophila pseudoobscura]|uniref:Enhancer of split m8 protein n=1 Tax=Drosophila pseudoobscura pseudoobscura TaxID=46245 RepID=A0A6I8UQL8_DROPS|nr:enhancer of split m8 protein [Drosophila pseudoobscura]
MEYTTKTQIYQKVKKPLLERQRRARINKCLDTLKTLVAELRGDDGILRMDKAEMLESAVIFMRQQKSNKTSASTATPAQSALPLDSFRNGYMNAVNEVSRVMASTPGMSVDLGKSVMTHLGRIYKNLQQFHEAQATMVVESESEMDCSSSSSAAPLSPASSGYHSDCESPAPSPMPEESEKLWRPW